jgi:hypothetical protein
LLWGVIITVVVLAATVAACSSEERVTVPDVVGLSTENAERVLEAAGFAPGDVEYVSSEAEAAEADTVLSQAPSAGGEADAGTEVALVVAEAPEETDEEDEVETPAAGSGGGAASGGSSGSGSGAGTDTTGAWHTLAKAAGTGDHIGPDFSFSEETPLELTVTVSSSPPGAEFHFYLLEATMGSHEMHATVTGTATSETHAFEPVTVPAGDYGMRIDIPALMIPPPPNVSWSYTLREWR